jgi:hypothetical protein
MTLVVKLGRPVGNGRRDELADGRGVPLGRPVGVGLPDGVGRTLGVGLPDGVGLPLGRLRLGTGGRDGRTVGMGGRLMLGTGILGRTLGNPPGRVDVGLTGASDSSGSSSYCGRAATRLKGR